MTKMKKSKRLKATNAPKQTSTRVNVTGTSFPITPKLGEPWIELPDGRALADWGREEEIAYNQTNRQTEKALFFRRTFDFVKDNRVHGDYYEFGCHRCRTFRMALTEARLHNMDDVKFWAFDSFEGLPDPTSDTSVEIWKSGALTTSETEFMRLVREHDIYVNRVQTIKGFYSNSLTRKLQRRFLGEENRVAFVNVDCDLYESAVPVFEFIEPLMQEGTIIYLDDVFAGYRGSPAKGVARAFLEYQQKSRWKFQRHLDIGWWGRSYIAYLEKEVPKGVL